MIGGGMGVHFLAAMLWSRGTPSRLDLDVYPAQPGSFTLYEDDGVTRGYARGEYAEQTFTVTPDATGITVGIGPSVGTYAGKVERRSYRLLVHNPSGPGTTVVEVPPLDTNAATTVRLQSTPPAP